MVDSTGIATFVNIPHRNLQLNIEPVGLIKSGALP